MSKIISMPKGGVKTILLIAVAIVILGAAGFFLVKSKGYLLTNTATPSGSANLTQTSPASDNTIDSELKGLDSDSSALDASFNDKAFDATGD